METLKPSPNELVVRKPAQRPGEAGEWELVDRASDTWLLRTSATHARDGWHRATQALKPHEWPLPVLRDADGVAHYPTGEVTVRFVEVPTDPALSRFARSQGVTLIRRNALEPRQAVFIPSPPAREWLFDLIDRLAAAPGIARVWANTESLYRRA